MAFLSGRHTAKSYQVKETPKEPQLCPHCHKDINAAPSIASSPEVVKSMIQAIQSQAGDKLTAWESEFIESVSSKEKLSPKQIAIIERIYGEKV